MQQPAYALVTQALQTNGNQLNPAIFTDSVDFFTNGVDTTTDGIDLALDYTTRFERFAQVAWALNANYHHTKLDSVRSTPAALSSPSPPWGISQTSRNMLGMVGPGSAWPPAVAPRGGFVPP